MSARLTNDVNALRLQLSEALGDAFSTPLWGAPEAMSHALKEVQRTFDSASVAASEKSIAQSVWTFRKSGTIPSFRDLKYICYGLGIRQGEHETSLLDDTPLYNRVIDEVHSLAEKQRQFRKCYQGLLSSYLNFPADDSASENERSNWAHLRGYLLKQLALLTSIEPVASWTLVLNEHQNLLKPAPCKRYAEALREDRWDELEALAEGLAISTESWVWKEAVLAHVNAVASIKADQAFKDELDLALHALNGTQVPLNDGIRKEGAANLLRRYAKCKDHPEHDGLLDLALAQFGKPWLNRSAWDAYVDDEAAMRLVDSWIKTGLIYDFFQLLAADGVADRSRMDFWPKFVPVIDDIWFAMGPYSLQTHDAKYAKLRRRIGRERILELSGAGQTNNAFIMRVRNLYIVEFGQKGRAAYIVHADNWKLPMKGGSEISLEAWRLRDSMSGTQMTHQPSDGWEDKFRNEICPRIGWWPDRPIPGRRPVPGQGTYAAPSRPAATSSTRASSENLAVEGWKNRLVKLGVPEGKIMIHRNTFWVHVDDSDANISRFLETQGFNYSNQRWHRQIQA